MARLHRAVDARSVRSRRRNPRRSSPLLHDVADLTARPASRSDPLFTGTEPARRLSDEIALRRRSRRRRADHDGWEAGLVDLSRDRTLANAKQDAAPSYRRRRDARQRVGRARRPARAARSVPHGRRRRSRGAPAAGARGALDGYEELKARAARSTSSTCSSARAIWCATTGRCARGSSALQAHLRRRVPGHRSAAGRDPAAARRRRPGRDRLAARTPCPASCSSSAIPSSRSTGSGAPTSRSIARSASSSRRAARRA